MLQFEVNGKAGKQVVKFPTTLTELSGDFLTSICKDIEVADNHAIVCLCYRETIANVLFTASSKKKNSITTAVVPKFVKAGNTDNDFIKGIMSGNTLVVPASDLALGYHVTGANNPYTINYLLKVSDGDTTLYQKALKFEDVVYFIEFKIIPTCNIKGYYSSTKVCANSNN